MASGERDLALENGYVVSAVQALLRLVTPDIVAVGLEFPGEHVTLKFWVRRDSADVREIVHEVFSELDALQLPGDPPLEVETVVGSPQIDWGFWRGRMVFWAKDSGAEAETAADDLIPIPDQTLGYLEELSARCDAGPWRSYVEGRDHYAGDSFIMVRSGPERGDDIYVTRDTRIADATELDLIAAARTCLPALINEIRRLR